VSEPAADETEFTVLLRSRSGARVRRGYYIDLGDFPDGLAIASWLAHPRQATAWCRADSLTGIAHGLAGLGGACKGRARAPGEPRRLLLVPAEYVVDPAAVLTAHTANS
jgi:hypothetical protein